MWQKYRWLKSANRYELLARRFCDFILVIASGSGVDQLWIFGGKGHRLQVFFVNCTLLFAAGKNCAINRRPKHVQWSVIQQSKRFLCRVPSSLKRSEVADLWCTTFLHLFLFITAVVQFGNGITVHSASLTPPQGSPWSTSASSDV